MRCFVRCLLLGTLGLFPALAQSLSLDLAWDYPTAPSIPQTGFFVYRSTAPDLASFGGPLMSTPLAPTLRAYRDTDLLENTRYCYYVSAVSLVGESLPSNVACFTFVPPVVPTAPTGVRGVWKP